MVQVGTNFSWYYIKIFINCYIITDAATCAVQWWIGHLLELQKYPRVESKQKPLKGSFTLVQIPQKTIALTQRDRKFSISVLMQSSVENADRCGKCESALNHLTCLGFSLMVSKVFRVVWFKLSRLESGLNSMVSLEINFPLKKVSVQYKTVYSPFKQKGHSLRLFHCFSSYFTQ